MKKVETNSKSILISCVNFNSNLYLLKFLESINQAYTNCLYEFFLTIVIGDNSDFFENLEYNKYYFNIIHVNNNQNFGYIGGIVNALKSKNISIDKYNYFIISNVDIILSRDFFNNLLTLSLTPEIGWIAPAIISEKENRDRNPKIIYRPSLKKMQLTYMFFKFPLLHYLYEQIIYKRMNKKLPESFQRNEIYAGHGSFMVFTKSFILKNKDFRFPSFLFGEEIYFAELIRKSNLKTLYFPEIKIYDYDHASTSKMKRSTYYRMNYDSIKILINIFFKNE